MQREEKKGRTFAKKQEVLQEARGFEGRSEKFCDRKDKENKWFAREETGGKEKF